MGLKTDVKCRSAGITAIGSHLPEGIITNDDLVATGLNTTSKWIVEKTGIASRRKAAPDECATDLAEKAAKKCMKAARINPDEIDLLISSGTGDYYIPTNSNLIAERLGTENAVAVDIPNYCSAFNYSLTVAEKFIADCTYDNVLIVGAEITSRFTDYTDRTTCIFFGDGAGAALVSPVDEGYGILSSYLKTAAGDKMVLSFPGGGTINPTSYETIKKRMHYIRMDGKAIWDFAIKAFPEAVREAVKQAGLTVKDIDLVIPHQANSNIIKRGMEELGLPMTKTFTNLHKYGNTTSASQIIALDEAIQQKKIKKDDNIVLAGFGAALSYGANVIKWAY
ncbi:MAG: beta-ketoacyl-ACP synthase 3 [Candidatus Altiarchaeota archaeon]